MLRLTYDDLNNIINNCSSEVRRIETAQNNLKYGKPRPKHYSDTLKYYRKELKRQNHTIDWAFQERQKIWDKKEE